MRVLFVTNNFYLPQSAGGSESSTHDLCSQLEKIGITDYAVLARLLPEKDSLWFKNRVKSFFKKQSHPSDNIMGYPVYRGWDVRSGVASVVKDFKPDIAIIQAGEPCLLANEFVQHGVRTVVYIRDVEFYQHEGQYPSSELVSYIANSQFTANAFLDEYNLSSTVIPPLVETKNYIVDSIRKYVVFVCPHPFKGVELAFRLAEENPDIAFMFVESWSVSDEDKLAYLARAKAAGNIKWLEKQSNMKNVYSQAKLMLVPSIWNEAWGRVVTESQVNGIPTLASNRGGLPESVGAGGIVLNPDADIELWNDALKRFCKDEVFYSDYVNKAFEHSQRDTIKASRLIAQFVDVLKEGTKGS